uniref:Uncharacterized protein n=1 Tax=Solanum tuberosum TaxID=4113 RepID=M1BM11_SOLTU
MSGDKALWSRLCGWLRFHRVIQDWETELRLVCMMAKQKAGRAEIVSSVIGMIVYVIWRERNKIRFQNRSMRADEVLKEIVMHMHINRKNRAKWHTTLQQLNAYP